MHRLTLVLMFALASVAAAEEAGPGHRDSSPDIPNAAATRPGAPATMGSPQIIGSSQRPPAVIPAPAHSFVVNIESGSMLTGRRFGRGICLDSPCVHVLTNYHVAAFVGRAKVEGVSIANAQFATGPADPAAVPMKVLGQVERFDPQRDLALLTLKRALPAQFGAARFAEYVPVAGQPVTRQPALTGTYSGRLRVYGAMRYIAADGITRDFNMGLLVDFDSQEGTSGSALCDGDGKVLGLVAHRYGSLALPVPVISEFLQVASPALWAQLRLEQAPVTRAALQEEELADNSLPTIIIGASEDSTAAVSALRERASVIRGKMARLVGEVEIRNWGPGAKRSTSRYEIGLFKAGTTFRRISATGEREAEIMDTPIPDLGFVPGAEWDYLLKGLEHATLTYSGETVFNDDVVHVFRFQGLKCPFREKRPTTVWSGDVDCSGEVFADAGFNPVRLRASLFFSPTSIVSELKVEVQLQRTTLPDAQAYFLPVQVNMSGRFRIRRGLYSTSAILDHYRLFAADHVIRTD